MGVPFFFAWLIKKYKKTNFIFQKENSSLELINWFLIDTNCLIHPVCFKILEEENKNNTNINFKSLENKMINAVIEYIEKLIKYVNPNIGVYISIDGPVCLAKMKQQRQRRFKSIHDKYFFDKIKNKHNIEIPYYWNNSAISPGTKFMHNLHNKLLIWSNNYIIENNIKIVYSSSNVPGEGEHKLLDFIKKNIEFNYSYVTYGLDADLIFLMLVINSDKIYLLREANQIDNKLSKDQLNFVNIKIMKDCIYDTFCEKTDNLPNLNKNRIINDFIFLCYFLGNDFLPHILALNIANKGIDIIISEYILTYLEIFDYLLSEKNTIINQTFLDLFLKKLILNEESYLFNNFTKKKRYIQGNNEYERELFKIDNLLFKIADPIGVGVDSNYRYNYYKHYFDVSDEELESFVENMVKEYLKGLKWVTNYYFDKLQDWTWFYPYDHAPFLSDISKYLININDIKLNIGTKPITPFEQLLNILPPQSAKYLLPTNLVKLTTLSKSSIIHLYPTNINIDYLYKHKYWEGIPKLPDMEIHLIKYIYSKYKDEINNEDIIRNRIDQDIIFEKN